ncbi:SLC13 family permease [Lentibacillus daqui]|uniref:SLC13 family permease n=1 Tax=Lentibacillus daqui TaxID=2911514 RepID=UPI0022B1B84A|nr:DASS family sodium-coupled anion symporter [Lentibacillus daqui]
MNSLAEKREVKKNKDVKMPASKMVMIFIVATGVFISLYFYLPDTFSHSAKIMTAIVCFGVILWALEPIPLGLTSLIVLVLMLLFKVAETDMIFSGFSSPAIYLIVGGMMLAKAVNETPLARRITYKVLKKWGNHSKGLLGSILLIMQLQAFFIPATAVRTTLMLPISTMIIKTVDARPGSNLRKMILLGIAFGGNISGTAVMTAAIGNILTVELLDSYANIKITYFQWFFYTFPLWLILIPAIWFLLLKVFPLTKKEQSFPMIKNEMEVKLKELGSISGQEFRCILILIFIVILWSTEPLHGLHPSIPAIIGVILMTLPGIGCAQWANVVKINYNTVLLTSVTLSMGYTLIDSGAANTISEYLSLDWVLSFVKNPLLAVIFIAILTQLFHKLISNVSTAVVTLVPIVISIAANANVDPMILGFTAGLTSLYGFILVVETMPNLLVHSSGMIDQKDFLKPGLYATIVSTVAIIIMACTWWRWIGLV